jgi:hypothetical protein
MNQYFNNRDHLFVSPSIRDTMKTSAYYRPNPNIAYQDESRMAELVGKFRIRTIAAGTLTNSPNFLSCVLRYGGRS